ncbi:homeobox-containing protein 1 [Parasteatoda tepidariorum]|uniref:homeobox-containing protein 1 n=1 Tax=Parasteatoda tepidariorum TaxID=114398 RepID=UPI001C7206E9|nr:homeobox-containing protein 1 [Parasteatoda tepidariorum]
MALFTVEQIELIRRLRSSGITREQVLLAFTELERFESEFGRTCSYGDQYHNHNMEFSFSSTAVVRSNCTASVLTGSSVPIHAASVPAVNGGSHQMSYKPNEYFNSQPVSQRNGTNTCEDVSDSLALNGDCSVNTADMSSRMENELALTPVNDSSIVSCSESMSQSAYNSSFNCSFYPMEVQSEELAELQELKKKGDMAVLAEIRNFVMTYNIKQTLIAEMTKMSQPYVSRFFRGDIQDMPDRTKNVFFMWYLTCKNNPLKLAQMCPSSGIKRMVSESGDLIPLKRERFTFKGSHLAVLEKYYEQDPYPDTQVREQIVEQCNKAAEKCEWPLSDRDTVTLPVVNNWFNNRRKDAKKQMRLKHGLANINVQSSYQASFSSVVPTGKWSPRSMSSSSSSSYHYQGFSNEITESDSSSTSERIIENDVNSKNNIPEQESCDMKHILAYEPEAQRL